MATQSGRACLVAPAPSHVGNPAARFTSFLIGSGYLNLMLMPREQVWGQWGRAMDAPLMIAGVARGGNPGMIVGHRAFDGESAAVVVGDDQVEWLRPDQARACS